MALSIGGVAINVLEDLESLRSGATQSDGVIHAAFNHDFSKFAENSQTDRQAIEVMGQKLAGSQRPMVVTSGLLLTPGRATTEDDQPPAGPGETPRVSE